ncbi:uncharacterized protein [Amphiura filiformis]|uniref:uncharacterized protein n=1 Tax=Amphiura filiformis TaxID=82378 RepID=UPI003B226861
MCTTDDSTWGHANADDKTTATATWTAPMSNEGDLTFRASVVQQNSGGTSIFYTGLMSEDLVYNGPENPTFAPTTTANSGSVRASLVITMVTLFTIAIIGRFL